MSEILKGKLGYKGETGDSAYEIAVKHGYTGTEEQWSDDFLNAENYYDKSEIDGRYAVVSGSVTHEEGESTQTLDLTWPDGFNANNCVIISTMLRNPITSNVVWGTGATMTLGSTVSGQIPMSISLKEDKISVVLRNIYLREIEGQEGETSFNDCPDIDFKIVLMKINTGGSL